MNIIVSVLLSILTVFSNIGAFFTSPDPISKSSRDFTFSPISAEEARVTEAEKKLCAEWFRENIVDAGANGTAPAYNFGFGFKTLRSTLEDWNFTKGEESAVGAVYRGGKTTLITAKSDKYGLTAEVEATLYEQNATCEWKVSLKNTAEKDSPVIHDFYAVETSFDTGKADLYFSKGSSNNPDDFTLYKASAQGKKYIFDCANGRSTQNYLSYFNICGEKFGFDLGIGWSGQWKATVCPGGKATEITAKQDTLCAYLLPGEEIRSPLVSLSFYQNTNPVKGFNTFRNWVKDCLYSENLPKTNTNADILFVSATRTKESMLYDIDLPDPANYDDVDYLWVDAGWYCTGKEDANIWESRFGWWRTYEERFPETLNIFAERARDLGLGLVLWYEPERLTNEKDSPLYSVGSQNKGWLIDKTDPNKFSTGVIWNFGNPEALDYISRYISASLKENGVSVFRQDSNFDPLGYWEYGDKAIYGNLPVLGGRKGICENHYVDGHYRFLDYLFADNEQLELYDVCASGGRRLDLEMTHRGIPMWRSDYNCDPHDDLWEATQAQSYGLAFWLPYTGTYLYSDNDYALRSSLYQSAQISIGSVANPDTMKWLMKYRWAREYLNDYFYPICSQGANTGIVAMQYGNEERGMLLIYKRDDVKAESFDFLLSGLDTGKTYTVTDIDHPESAVTLSGEELMKNPLTAKFGTGKEALIFTYSLGK